MLGCYFFKASLRNGPCQSGRSVPASNTLRKVINGWGT